MIRVSLWALWCWWWGNSKPGGRKSWLALCTVLLEKGFCPFFGKNTDLNENQLLGHTEFQVFNQKHMCTNSLDWKYNSNPLILTSLIFNIHNSSSSSSSTICLPQPHLHVSPELRLLGQKRGMPMTDTFCLVKTHIDKLCLHWKSLLPWTKQIPTIKTNSLRCQNARPYDPGIV